MRCKKPEVSISPDLETVPGCGGRTDGRADGQTDRITIATTLYSYSFAQFTCTLTYLATLPSVL